MAASSRWQEKQRQGTRVLKDGQKPVNYGLMPRGMGDCGLMDDKDMNGIFLPHNIWAVYADRLSVEAAQLLGREADLPELQKIYDTGREDLLRALDAGAMDAKYYRQCLDPFLADWERWHLAEIFGRPEDYFRACLSANAAQRTLGLNALRSNPNLIGYSMTSLFDEVGCGEGLITMFRDLKPGILDAMRDGWAPLRWSLFVAPYQLYRVARSFVDDPTTLPPVKADLAIWGKAEGLEKWLKEHGIAFHAVAAGQPLEKRETILVVGKAAKNAAPNGKGNPSTEQTYFTVLSPTNPSGAVVVFCSGGGYGCLANLGDPPPMFELLKPYGVTLVVLEYRLPRGNSEIPLLDAQRMLRHVRYHAKEWKCDPKRVGVMGISAGGHLAATAATSFDDGNPKSDDPVERMSCRPDFAVLLCPVITMGTNTHAWSRENLLGRNPTPEMIQRYSAEKQVTEKTCPCFLAHAQDDRDVPPGNSQAFYEALLARKVPAEYVKV